MSPHVNPSINPHANPSAREAEWKCSRRRFYLYFLSFYAWIHPDPEKLPSYFTNALGKILLSLKSVITKGVVLFSFFTFYCIYRGTGRQEIFENSRWSVQWPFHKVFYVSTSLINPPLMAHRVLDCNLTIRTAPLFLFAIWGDISDLEVISFSYFFILQF